MRVLGSGRAFALAACLALLLAAAPVKAIIGSILQIAQMATLVSNTASLLQEAEKRLSGRALARAPLGGGFPALPFRLQGGFSVPPSATFPAALPKIRTSGFPTVRLQASGTLQFGTELSAAPPRLRLIRPCPRALPAFSPSFDDPARRRGTPPLCAAPPRRPRRHLCPEVLAPSGLCCPGLPRLPTSSASQENSRPFPGIRRL